MDVETSEIEEVRLRDLGSEVYLQLQPHINYYPVLVCPMSKKTYTQYVCKR